jgi:hypothetical protein
MKYNLFLCSLCSISHMFANVLTTKIKSPKENKCVKLFCQLQGDERLRKGSNTHILIYIHEPVFNHYLKVQPINLVLQQLNYFFFQITFEFEFVYFTVKSHNFIFS